MTEGTFIYWVDDDTGRVDGVKASARTYESRDAVWLKGDPPPRSYCALYLLGDPIAQVTALRALQKVINTRIIQLRFGLEPEDDLTTGTVKCVREGGRLY